MAMLLVMLMTMIAFAVTGVAADENPIRVSSLSEPQSVIAPQEVDITIKVYNSAQTDIEEKITLYDPVGTPVETYEGLKSEQSVTYQGKWNVTAEEIEKGKISFYIRYTVTTQEGPKEVLNSVPVTIQTEAAAPQLTATYTVSPQSARPGQTVSVAYTLSNTGNIELRDIVIKNEGVSKESVKAVSLSVGEKLTLESSFTMGEKELVSKPTITYQAAGSDKKLTISDLAKKTITVAEDGLEASVEAKTTENIYPSEKVAMTLKLKNTGNRAYTNLTATGSDGTAIVSGVELAPGASHETRFELTVSQDTEYTVSVAGADSQGESVSIASEAVALKTQDASKALVLNILAQARETTIYSEPAVIRMAVLVENIGQTDATTLTIKEGETEVAKIASLPSGESRTLVFDIETSIAGKLCFTVSGKDAAGSERTYESNVIQINYIEPTSVPTAAPTPAPTPSPTPVPPTPTPVPSIGEQVGDAIAAINPVVLYSAAGVLAALLVVLVTVNVVASAQRKKRMEQAIDTLEIEREYRPRDYRGTHKGGKKAKPEEKEDAPDIDPERELTDEQAVRMKEEAKAAQPAREEGRRRRTAHEPEVSSERTLRVAPVEDRPEFVAQGAVDDSQTRVFGKFDTQEMKAITKETTAEPTASEPDASEPTIRFNAQQLEEILEGEKKSEKRKPAREALKKKKSFFGFGRKKEKDEDDFIDDEIDDLDGDEDDFIE